MMIDSHARRTAEIIRNGKDFVGRFTLAEQPLRVRTRRADRKQLRRGTDKPGKEQLLAIEFRAEPCHRVKQSACKSLARARGVIDVAQKYFVQVVDLARAIWQPLARIPTGIKFSRTQNGFRAIGHRQLRVENRAADFQMWIKRLARDEEPHDFAGTFEDCVDSTIAQKS